MLVIVANCHAVLAMTLECFLSVSDLNKQSHGLNNSLVRKLMDERLTSCLLFLLLMIIDGQPKESHYLTKDFFYCQPPRLGVGSITASQQLQLVRKSQKRISQQTMILRGHQVWKMRLI